MAGGRVSSTKLALLGRTAWSEQGALRSSEPIALVGMGCRFPGGVRGPDDLWRLLVEGRDAVTEVPPDRWDLDAWFDADPAARGRIATRWGGFLDDIRGFDAAYFDISPREAERMDPQQRIALEVACEAVEHAGMPVTALRGTDAAVFFAAYHDDYTLLQYAEPDGIGARTLTGTLHSVLANRISYLLDIHGPSVAVDSACSSSLVAIHLACQALRSRDCDVALAGGVSVMITPHVTIALSKGGFMSPTGRCRAFDAAADGFVRSEGCGVVVLKRLADAVADGDDVWAVLRGSAVNQDGESTNLAAPNGRAQAALVRRALDNAGLSPRDVSLLEAHGTGTHLGDPIETDALAEVFRGRDPAAGPCYLGSLKANLGHCEAAAGVGGVIKSVLCLRHGAVPPHVHFRELNPHIDLSDTPFRIVRETTPWAAVDGPRVAGVSSFGVGGTNAHVLLEEPPEGLVPVVEPPAPPFVLPLSARSAASLRGLAAGFAERLRRDPGRTGLYARAAGRRTTSHRPHRAGLVAPTGEALVDALDQLAAGVRPGAEPGVDVPPVAFVFTGQGSQWPGMGLAVAERHPAFAEVLRQIDGRWRELGGPSLMEELARPAGESTLERTDVVQVAIFAVQAGLVELLAGWGIRPSLVVGHSVGEIAAAWTAGLVDLDEAVRLVVERGRAMQATWDRGRMVAVRGTEERVREVVEAAGWALSVAAVNGPRSVVLAGPTDVMSGAWAGLEAAGLEPKRLQVRFAFHSDLMADAARSLEDAVGPIRSTPGRVAMISTVTGGELTSLDAPYLARNIREPVRFAAAVEAALARGVSHFVEIGPHPALGPGLLETAAAREDDIAIGYALHRDRSPALTLGALAARSFEWGLDPDWTAVDPGPSPAVDLPRYPWDHREHWLPAAVPSPGASLHPETARPAPPLPGRRVTSPALRDPVFELDLGDAALTALHDHRVAGGPILPATALLEWIRSAGRSVEGGEVEVRELGILRPVQLDGAGRLQLVLAPDARGGRTAAAYVTEDGDGWAQFATARVVAMAGDPPEMEPLPAAPAPAPGTEGDGAAGRDALYAAMERDGCEFGGAFRLLTSVLAGQDAGRGTLDAEGSSPWQGDVHPAVVDACAQLCVAVMETRRGPRRPGALLPWAVDRYLVSRPTARVAAGRVALRSADADGATFDIDAVDAEGRAVVCLRGWRLRAAPTAVAPLRSLPWSPGDALPEIAPPSTSHPWLVLGEGDDGAALAAAFEATGRAARSRALPRDDADEVLRPPDGGAWAGAVVCVPPGDDGDGVSAAAGAVTRSLLAAARALDRQREPSPRLVVVTQGTQATGDGLAATDPVGGAAWGLARAIRAELPDLRCLSVDVERAGPRRALPAAAVVHEALAGNDAEVALRDGQRRVARLKLEDLPPVDAVGAASFRLVHASPGTLDRFVLHPDSPPAPGAGEVEVEVRAAGLNFRDVLTALGAYPGEARIGHECAGRVVRVGTGVDDLSPGDPVLVFRSGCFGSRVVAPREWVFPAPASLGPAESATVPVVFGTAYHALHRIADIGPGDRVLVHSGAGGVGMAAIQLALAAGAEVYATAGTEAKRERLVALGVSGAFDSRSTDFEAGVMEATAGEGVDVVLNALIGDLIAAGLRCLREGGVFVELGKRELLTDTQVAEVRDDVRYVAFDLREEGEADPGLLAPVFRQLAARFDAGELTPLPRRTFRMADAGAAFRHMARADHIGKIVLVPGGSGGALDGRGWIVVSGGLGALGRATARWLVSRGARHIALLSRSAPDGVAGAFIDDLGAVDGVDVRALRVDVTDPGQVREALAGLRATGRPIVGIVHAAGVVRDALLTELDDAGLAAVLAPKVAGAWNLHRATLSDPVSLFAMYSAAGPVVSAAGQGNYAAANGFMDALATHRRSRGLPAVSVLWGPWEGGGMAEGLDEAQRRRWERFGLAWWTPETGVAALDQLLGPVPDQVLAVRAAPSRRTPASGAIRGAAATQTTPALARRLAELPPHRRIPTLEEHVRTTVTAVLGREAPVPVEVPLRDLGMDSLSAIEVRNALSLAAGISLPATLAFDHPTVSAVARHLLQLLGYGADDMDAPVPPAPSPPTGSIDVEAVAAMSEEEAERALWAELERGGPATEGGVE